MNKKGFTLIELLAVIVILAIIALIATPVILGIINNVKEESNKRSIEMYAKAIENSVATHQLQKSETIAGKFNTIDGENIVLIGETEPKLNINYEGNVVCNTIEIYVDGSIYLNECKVNRDEVETIYGNKASFATDSWETIISNVKAGYMYNVGDTKELTLKGFTNEEKYENGNNIGTYTARIANNSTPEECATEDFSQTACGFVIEFVDVITKYNMNPSGEYKGLQYDKGWNVDGYPASSMYTYIKNDIYQSLPEYLKKAIIDTKVVSAHGPGHSNNFISIDKLYLLSPKEVWGNDNLSTMVQEDKSIDQTRQLDYYKNYVNTDGIVGVTTDNITGAIKKYNGKASGWWLRSARYNNPSFFFATNNKGGIIYAYAYGNNGIAPAFRIG